MVICGIVLVITGIVWISRKKKLSQQKKKMFGILALAAVFGILAGMASGTGSKPMGDYLLARNEYGGGSYQKKMVLEVEGYKEELKYVLTVPEQKITRKEEMRYLAAAVEEIQHEFPGENKTVNHIEKSVTIRDTYQDGKVMATWSFDNYELINLQGEIIAKDLPEEGKLVKTRVLLTCGSTEQTEEFYFRIFPETRNEEEELFWQIEHMLNEQEDVRGQVYLQLPEMISDRHLVWRAETNHMSEKLLIFGMVLAFFVPAIEYSKKQEQNRQKDRRLELEYPEMVSKIALLIGAGMTLQGAVRKTALTYEKKKKQRMIVEMPAYEELLVTCREIENGMGERAAYERLGERCKRAEYRKLGSMLAQNLRKGNYSIVTLLEQEAENAFMERKDAAKRYGEEAGTKLLFPMLLMLILVIVVLMVPAVLAFQI